MYLWKYSFGHFSWCWYQSDSPWSHTGPRCRSMLVRSHVCLARRSWKCAGNCRMCVMIHICHNLNMLALLRWFQEVFGEPVSLCCLQICNCMLWEWMTQSESTLSQKPNLSMVTKWMGDHYVPGFAPALRFLWNQSLCRLYKSPLDETINWGSLCKWLRSWGITQYMK